MPIERFTSFSHKEADEILLTAMFTFRELRKHELPGSVTVAVLSLVTNKSFQLGTPSMKVMMVMPMSSGCKTDDQRP